MTFVRSREGIRNVSIFKDADAVVYIESDPEISSTFNYDVMWWSSFFQNAYPSIRFCFKPMGGKKHVIEMAHKIIGDSIPNTFCALDRDHDHYFGKTIKDPRVFYTFGYGVENDCLNQAMVTEALLSAINFPNNIDNIVDGVKSFFDELNKQVRWPVRADIIAYAHNKSVLDRKSPGNDLHFGDAAEKIGRFRRINIIRNIKKVTKDGNPNPFNRPLRVDYSKLPAHHYMEIIYIFFLIFADITE